jgi:uncharacterized protein (DUF362 family)
MAEPKDQGNLSRRGFLVGAAAAAVGLGALRSIAERQSMLRVRGPAENSLAKAISIIHGDAPTAAEEQAVVTRMTRTSIEAIGGMAALVKKGDTVVIKPNIAWVRPPAMAANTNPYVVAALVRMCLEAGAGAVKVMDNTISKSPANSYETSGIAKAAADAGAEVPFVDLSRAVMLEIPKGAVLTSWPFCREFVDADLCDVLINVPVLKQHGTSRMSIGLKNAFGMVAGERGQLHPQIHEKIPDLHRVLNVDLTVMDAYRVMRTHGPTGGSLQDVDNSLDGARRIVASRDPVAVDAYGASLFGYSPDDVGFVQNAAQAGLGTADWQSLQVVEKGL